MHECLCIKPEATYHDDTLNARLDLHGTVIAHTCVHDDGMAVKGICLSTCRGGTLKPTSRVTGDRQTTTPEEHDPGAALRRCSPSDVVVDTRVHGISWVDLDTLD